MIKLTFCLRRLPHLTRQQFQEYWHECHAPLVARYANALRIRRYVQVHTVEDPFDEMLRASRGACEPYDGVAELWWESREDLQTAIATPEGQKAVEELRRDEERFIDAASCALWLGKEYEIVSA